MKRSIARRAVFLPGPRKARGRLVSIGDAPLVQQPGMDNLPLIAPAWPEFQKRRPPVLKLAIKLQRIPCGCRWWINRLGSNPAVPFQKKKRFPFVLSHRLRVLGKERERPLRASGSRAGFSGKLVLFENRRMGHPEGAWLPPRRFMPSRSNMQVRA